MTARTLLVPDNKYGNINAYVIQGYIWYNNTKGFKKRDFYNMDAKDKNRYRLVMEYGKEIEIDDKDFL